MEDSYRIPVTDDQDLAAIRHDAGTDRYVFISHGASKGKKQEKYIAKADLFADQGWNAVRFDSRGYGESDGTAEDRTVSKRIEDLQAVMDYFDPDKCVLYGSSLGGKPALHTAVRDDRVIGAAARAPLTRTERIADVIETIEDEGQFPPDADREDAFVEAFADDIKQYDFSEVTDQLTVPVAIFQGQEDETFPIEYTWEVANELQGDVTVYAYEGEGHSLGPDAREQMEDDLAHWLDRL